MRMNCLLVSDFKWDNMPIVMKRIAKIPKDTRMNIFYGNKTEEFSRIVLQNELNLMRRNIKNFSAFASVMDYCIIFTNLIEYNNHSRYIIDFCEENNVPYVVFTEIDSGIYLNMEKTDSKFSKILKTFTKSRSQRVTKPFEEETFSKITNIDSVRLNLRNRYAAIKAARRAIVVI